jgi:hypothetical protein
MKAFVREKKWKVLVKRIELENALKNLLYMMIQDFAGY